MTALSRTELGVLLQHGDRRAVASRLHHSRKPDDPHFTHYIFMLPYLAPDPEGLQVERHGINIRLHHGEQEVFRRTSDAMWRFPEDGGPPGYSAQPRFDAASVLRPLLEPYQFWAEQYPLDSFHPQEAETVTVAGHPAVRIPIYKHDTDPWPLRSIDVDTEHGVILAADTVRERIEVAEISFPDTLPDPAWTGPLAQQPANETPLPPSQPGLLRIRVDKWELPQVEDIRVGQQIRIPLRFAVDAAAPTQLRRTVRGQVTGPHALISSLNEPPRWRALLLTDDWHAELSSPAPFDGEVEVTGVLEHGDEFGAPVKDVVVDKLFLRHDGAWHPVAQAALRSHPVREMLIDAHPSRATAPLNPRAFQPVQQAVDDEHLWLADRELPVARCWSLITGEYVGQVLVPTPPRPGAVAIHLSNGHGHAIASANGGLWALHTGQPVASALPKPVKQPVAGVDSAPVLPAGWTLDRWFKDGLFSAVAMPPLKEAIQMAVGRFDQADPTAPVRLRNLDTGSWGLLNGFQLGEDYYFTISPGCFRVDSQFEQAEFAAAGSAVSHEVFDQVVLVKDSTQLRFLDRESGEELTSLDQVTQMLSRPLRVTRDQIVVLRQPTNSNPEGSISPESVWIWTPGTGWTKTSVQAGPDTLY